VGALTKAEKDNMTNHRGFSAISPDRQREIASKGGKAAHANGSAHEFTPDEARIAGTRGAIAVKAKYGRSYTEHMAEIGRKGGLTRAKNKAEREHASSQKPAT
jgi:general stress protein YciG